MKRLLVAGATGALGKHVVRAAKARGFWVRAMGRKRPFMTPQPSGSVAADVRKTHDAFVDAGVRGALDDVLLEADEFIVADALDADQLPAAFGDVDVVFSSLGASVSPELRAGSRGYLELDTPANLNLIAAGRASGVEKFVYVSVALHEKLAHLAYVEAHERVVRALKASGMSHAVLRPTGFFSAFATIFDLAAKGSVPYLGNLDVKTNPIADADLAELAVQALEHDVGDVVVGGPEVLTRRQIIEAAFVAQKLPIKLRRVPTWVVKSTLPVMQLFNRRVADITRFYLAVSSQNCVAPPHGQSTIGEYFARRASRLAS